MLHITSVCAAGSLASCPQGRTSAADLLPRCVHRSGGAERVLFSHQEAAYAALFHAAWDTLKSFGEKAGVQLGMTALLHTWGSNLVFHPHLHCIVPGGGRRTDGDRWKTLPQVKAGEKEPFLFPVKALGDMFRAKYMAELSSVGKVSGAVRTKCFAKPWVVYAKSPVSGAESTLEYLSRYAYRVAIGDSRILSVDDENVSFEYI